MAKLSGILKFTRSIDVDYFGHPIRVAYRPAAFTRAYYQFLQDSRDEPGSLYPAFERIVESWDLQDDDGQPIPVDAATLEGLELPADLLPYIFKCVNEDRTDLGKS